MTWKDYITPVIIIICIIFIIILLSITLPILYNWVFIPKSVTEVPSNIASTSTALIVALISIITLLITINQTNKSLKQTEITITDNKTFNTESLKKTDAMMKNNREYNEKTLQLTNKSLEKTDAMIKNNREYKKKTLKLTNETINQSEEIMYIQLRFDSAEKSLFIFRNKLTDAHIIYNELIAITSKDYFFNPRGYLIAQYTNWLFDLELLEHLPRGLINRLDAEFEKNGNIYPVLDFEKYLSSINSFSELDNKKCERELRSHYEFSKFIKEFNDNCKSGRFIDKFKELYMSNLNEMEIVQFIIFTREEIKKRSVEDFIYEEKLLKLDIRRMKRKINENKLKNN